MWLWEDKMKKMSHKRCRAAALTLIVCLWLSGCASSVPDFFAYRESGFCAECRGVLFGESFCARLSAEPLAAGYRVTVEYLAPESLAGVHISAVCNKEGSGEGEATLTLHGVARALPYAAAEGLLLPVKKLLQATALQSVCRTEAGWELKWETGEVLSLTSDAIPSKFCSDSAEFWVVWWKNQDFPMK